MNYFLVLAGVLLIYMSAWFVLSVIKRRNDVADVAWGIGFVLLAWTSFFLGQTHGVRGLLTVFLISVWGVRLAWHIHRRNKGRVEDYRYAAWREQWGKWFYVRSYAQVYLLQGILLYMVSLPVLLVNVSDETIVGTAFYIGAAVWIIGFFFESVGDAQLARFMSDPRNKGKLMQSGLWRYTRHPNYFGEVTQWWGIWIISIPMTNFLVGIVGPLTITVLILKVSGIPMLEKKMEENPQFAEYKKRTSMFIPWFVRKDR